MLLVQARIIQRIFLSNKEFNDLIKLVVSIVIFLTTIALYSRLVNHFFSSIDHNIKDATCEHITTGTGNNCLKYSVLHLHQYKLEFDAHAG